MSSAETSLNIITVFAVSLGDIRRCGLNFGTGKWRSQPHMVYVPTKQRAVEFHRVVAFVHCSKHFRDLILISFYCIWHWPNRERIYVQL